MNNQNNFEISPQSEAQENTLKDINVKGNLTFAPVQIGTQIETQVIQMSVSKVTQQPLIKISPYQGLRRFNFKDRERFFGRDKLIANLFDAVNQSSFNLILGASGSGKSSVVRAGLIPELKKSLESNFYDFIFTPNDNPFESLYRCLLNQEKDYNFLESEAEVAKIAKVDTIKKVITALKKDNERWLIFIDQFEEVFTICQDVDIRKKFIEAIVSVANMNDSSVRIVLAMRSDFLEQFSFHPHLAEIINKQQNIHLITEMYSDELRQAIEQPAAKHGVVFEEGLVEQIIKDVEGQSGCLPLLQYTLNLLWERECTTIESDGRACIEDRVLNRKSYAELEGVRGALQKRINDIYQALPQDEQEATRKIFINLVNIVDTESGSKVVSRRAYRHEFTGELIQKTIDKFIDKKLLISSNEYTRISKLIVAGVKNIKDAATVEIVHEILLSSWDVLKRWLEQEKEAIILKNWLAGETRRWQKMRSEDESKAQDELLKGSRLAQVVEYTKKDAFKNVGGLSKQEEEFINASVEWCDLQEKEKEVALKRELAQAQELAAEQSRRAEVERQRAQEQTNAARSLRQLVVGLVVVFLGAAGAAVFAMIQTGEAQRLRLGSIVQALAGQAPRQLELLKQDERGTLLARQAYLFNQNTQNQVLYQANVNDALRAVLGFRYFSAVLRDHTDRVWSVAFSSDGHTMASGSLDGTIRVWNLLQPGTKPIVLRGHENWVTSVAFSPDGQMLASGGDDKTVQLWDLRQPGAKPTIFNHKDRIWSVAFSPDGHTIASGSEDKTVNLWDLQKSSAKPMVLNGHDGLIRSLAFSRDGQVLASGSDDKTVRLWDLQKPSAKPTVLTGHLKAVTSVAFSQNGQILASGSQDNTVRLWNLRQPNSTPTVLNGHNDIVRSVAFSFDGQVLASGSNDKTVRLWDLQKPSAKPIVLTGHLEPVSSVAFSLDNQMLTSGSEDKTVRLWDLQKPSAASTILRQKDSVSSVAFSPDSNMLASGSESGYWTEHNIQLWNLRQPSAKPIILNIPNSAGIYSVAFSPDGQMLASSAQSMDKGKGGVQLWNLGQPGSKPTVLSEARGYSLAFSPDGHTLASAGYKEIQIWNLRQLESEPLVLKGHDNYVTSVAFSPDGHTIASGSRDKTVRLWNLQKPNAAPIVLRGHENEVWSVAFSTDGHTIASGSNDNTVRLWNLNQPNAAAIILSGHEDKVRSVAFSRDGQTLASSSNDQTVRLWDMRQPNAVPTILRAVLRSHTDGFSSVAFSQDGQSLASGSDDGSIRIWNVNTKALADKVCEKVWRNLTLSEWRRFVGEDITYKRTCDNLPADSQITNNIKPRSAPAQKLVAPVQKFPTNKTIFNYSPRVATLRWSDVPGATSYTVEIEFCQSGGCSANNAPWILASNLQSTSYTFDFVGAQPGRWRVWAVDTAGRESSKSEWWEFEFTR